MLSNLWSPLRYRWRALFARGAMEAELDEEVRFHLDREAAKLEGAGHSRAEAWRRAAALPSHFLPPSGRIRLVTTVRDVHNPIPGPETTESVALQMRPIIAIYHCRSRAI